MAYLDARHLEHVPILEPRWLWSGKMELEGVRPQLYLQHLTRRLHVGVIDKPALYRTLPGPVPLDVRQSLWKLRRQLVRQFGRERKLERFVRILLNHFAQRRESLRQNRGGIFAE